MNNAKEKFTSDEYLIFKNGLTYPVAETHSYSGFLTNNPITQQQAYANAKLFAAAPELLEALDYASDMLYKFTFSAVGPEEIGPIQKRCEQIFQLMKQARGES